MYSATDEAIHKKMFGTTALISTSKELNDIMKIVISLEEFVFVFKRCQPNN